VQNYHQLKNKIGVYLLYTNEELSYIGRSSNLQKRLNQHFYPKDQFYQEWKSKITKIEYYLCSLIGNTDIIETYLINKLNPIFNIDKVYIGGIDLFIELPEKHEIKIEKKEKVENCSYSFYNICKSLINKDISLESIEISHPEVVIAFNKLGPKKIRALGCNITKIRYELNNFDKQDEIYQHIKNNVKPGFYTSADAKVKLKRIYSNYGIKKSPKTSDFEKALNVKLISKLIDGKRVRGYKVIF